MGRDKIDRRRFIRIKFPFTTHIYSAKSAPISAYTEDISEGGVKITIRQEIKELDVVDLEIYVKLRPVTCKGKVVWVKRRESEYFEDEVFYDIGMEFQELNSEDKTAINERLEKVIKERKAKEVADEGLRTPLPD